jgi:two-component system nitrate/nitrite response regulator NarL
MSTPAQTKILLVDDHAIVLDGIASLLSSKPNLQIVGKANDGAEAMRILETQKADLVITDRSMEGMDGLALIHHLYKAHPGIKIIMLSMHDEPSLVMEAINTGVDGYILKKYTHDELMTAIEAVIAGKKFRSPEINKILLGRSRQEPAVHITDREMEVLKLLVNELTSREIAKQLSISERTVETHRKNLLRKANATNAVGLIKYAHAHRLLPG